MIAVRNRGSRFKAAPEAVIAAVNSSSFSLPSLPAPSRALDAPPSEAWPAVEKIGASSAASLVGAVLTGVTLGKERAAVGMGIGFSIGLGSAGGL